LGEGSFLLAGNELKGKTQYEKEKKGQTGIKFQ